MTADESVPTAVTSSVSSSPAWLSPRSSTLPATVPATTARRVSDPMFSAAYSPLDRPLLAAPLRRPHRAPPSARMANRFTGRPSPTVAASGAASADPAETISTSQTLPLPVGSRRAVSRSAEVLDKMDVGGGGSAVAVAAAHSPFPGRTPRRRAATLPSYSDDDDTVDEDDDEYEAREPATLKLVRLQTEINDRKRRLHQLLRRVNSLERTNHPADVDRWGYPDARQIDGWDRSVAVPPPPQQRRYVASPQRLPPDFAVYQPPRWTPVRGAGGTFAIGGPHHPPPPPPSSSRQPPARLYRSLSYDTDRDPFLGHPLFDRLPPGVDQSYVVASPHRLPRNAAVVRPYIDPARRRYEPPGPSSAFLPLPAAPRQRLAAADWMMTWSPRRSPAVYAVGAAPMAPQSHVVATPKCSPRHFDAGSVRSRSSTASVHDPTTKRVLLTPDPRRTLSIIPTTTTTTTTSSSSSSGGGGGGSGDGGGGGGGGGSSGCGGGGELRTKNFRELGIFLSLS